MQARVQRADSGAAAASGALRPRPMADVVLPPLRAVDARCAHARVPRDEPSQPHSMVLIAPCVHLLTQTSRVTPVRARPISVHEFVNEPNRGRSSTAT